MNEIFNKNFKLFYQNQDQTSFEKIYLITSTQMFGVLASICPSKECAQDCLQEGYIKLWKNIKNYDSKIGKPLPWLMTIFRNQAIDAIRKNRAKLFKQDYDIDVIDIDHNQAEDKIESIQTIIDLNNCIAQLQKDQKNALFMHYYNNMTYENIAQSLCFPKNTIKTWVRRSKVFILRCMKKHLDISV